MVTPLRTGSRRSAESSSDRHGCVSFSQPPDCSPEVRRAPTVHRPALGPWGRGGEAQGSLCMSSLGSDPRHSGPVPFPAGLCPARDHRCSGQGRGKTQVPPAGGSSGSAWTACSFGASPSGPGSGLPESRPHAEAAAAPIRTGLLTHRSPPAMSPPAQRVKRRPHGLARGPVRVWVLSCRAVLARGPSEPGGRLRAPGTGPLALASGWFGRKNSSGGM